MKNSYHTPILLEELLGLFVNETKSYKKNPKQILDCTFGRGGHSLTFLKKYPEARILAFDRDLEAIEWADTLKQNRLKAVHQNFYEFPNKWSHESFYRSFLDKKPFFDLILMDLGLSSPQLDKGDRGFSFNNEGPLDMRMDQTQEFKAENILNSFSKKELISLFQTYGEIKYPFSVVNELIQRRKKKKIETTREFVEIIEKYHSPIRHRHPATKWFLALRIVVNYELKGLKQCLPLYLSFLKPGAFLAVISFHSLEDRIVKQHFRDFVKLKQGSLYNKKIIRPTRQEIEKNIRSRSARLRVFQKNLIETHGYTLNINQ